MAYTRYTRAATVTKAVKYSMTGGILVKSEPIARFDQAEEQGEQDDPEGKC